tara:strand:+ start:401 stop:589 length:189 start_codon:yes stop_codon:yes gene_type:complete
VILKAKDSVLKSILTTFWLSQALATNIAEAMKGRGRSPSSIATWMAIAALSPNSTTIFELQN